MRALLGHALKLLVTLAIFVGLFAEFGGGPVEVPRDALADGTVWFQSNPAMPGAVGRLRARLTGRALPEAHVPLPAADVCTRAAGDQVYARTVAGPIVPVRALRHCREDRVAVAFDAPDEARAVPLEALGSRVWLRRQGFQLVPMDARELWREVTRVEARTFLPWFAFAVLVKLAGILVNVLRWQVLLRGQGLDFSYGWLVRSYFVGRYFGIVTPNTMGLDGWRLYDTIRATRRPVACATALAVERLVGLVGLLTVILAFMPFADLGGRSLAELVRALALPLAASGIVGVLVLLRPTALAGLVRFLPHPRLRAFADSSIRSATAYAERRGALAFALLCAVVGQVTTMLMYFGNAMALQVEGVTAPQVFYAAAVMTLGTFLAPSASGEGVRELVFVALLGGHTTAARAFLIGHLGFWIEKLPLSLPGLWPLLRAPGTYTRVTAEDLRRLRDEATAEEQAARAGS
ncbi:MAG: hypothetical protein RLZZ299_2792 [Pseudomonadota bacterium]|jgi:uncharacterized membrane protein YbhN (UPF0104 family)